MRYATALITMTVAAMAACNPPESVQEQPPAEELQGFDPAQQVNEPAFADAPSPEVRRAARAAALEVEEGQATFYADRFEGRRTASGRPFRQSEMVAAHRAFPFGTRLRVTNARNDREVEVRVVDRGPFHAAGTMPPVLDLSRAAAEQLDFIGEGRAQVRVEVLEWGP